MPDDTKKMAEHRDEILLDDDPRTSSDPLAKCTVCGMSKRPYGRSVPMEAENGMCGWDCPGYTEPPHAGYLWPGEDDDHAG